MAEGQSMTVADVVAQVRDGRLEDFVREAVALVARELMEAEISAEIGAELGEVAPETRLTHRNGYRHRGWETRVGEIELLIPKKRSGPSYFPAFLGAAPALGAGDRRGRARGVRQRCEHPQGRPSGRAAGHPRDDQGPRQCACAGRWTSRSSCSASGRWRAPTRTCGLTRRWSRSAITAGSFPRRSWWRTRCTSPVCAR